MQSQWKTQRVFAETEKLISKFIWIPKGTWMEKILEKEDMAGGLRLLSSKTAVMKAAGPGAGPAVETSGTGPESLEQRS